MLAAGGVHYLEGDEVSAGGLRVWGGPWQPEFGGWAFNLPRGAALAEKWAAIPEGLDLLITHGPPEGFGDRSWHASRTGCVELRARVDLVRPKLHLFGHIHEDGGAWTQGGTTFINCTTWECERAATVIDLDLVGRTMTVEAPPARPPRRE